MLTDALQQLVREAGPRRGVPLRTYGMRADAAAMDAKHDNKFYNHRDTEDTERRRRRMRRIPKKVPGSSLCSLCLCGKQNGFFSSADLTGGEVAL